MKEFTAAFTACIVMVATTALNASYVFTCEATARVASVDTAGNAATVEILETQSCGTHLTRGETKKIPLRMRNIVTPGRQIHLRYQYRAPECLSGKTDCHREIIEIIPGRR